MKKKNVNKILGDFNAVPKIIYESILYGKWNKAFLVPYTQTEQENEGVKSIQKTRRDDLAIVITEDECHYGANALMDYIENECQKLLKDNTDIEGFVVRSENR